MSLEQSAIVQVLLRERIRISGSVLPIVRDADSVDDIFQQVALLALQTREHFTEPEHVVAWALRAARHRAIDLLRAHKLQCLDESVLDLLAREWTVDSAPEVSGHVEALRQCMEKLPEQARSLLRLRYEEGLPCAGVAKRLPSTLDAVYQRLSRLHRQLRLCVEQRLLASGRLPTSQEGSLGEALT